MRRSGLHEMTLLQINIGPIILSNHGVACGKCLLMGGNEIKNFLDKLFTHVNAILYCSIPARHPFLGKRPYTKFQVININVAASIHM